MTRKQSKVVTQIKEFMPEGKSTHCFVKTVLVKTKKQTKKHLPD